MPYEKIKLELNKSIVLKEPDRAWIVNSGEIDIFSAIINKNNEYESSLNYLYSAKKEEVLFSLLTSSRKNNSDIKILIVSKEATLTSVSIKDLLKINHVQLKNMIENWFLKATSSLFDNSPPRVYIPLEKEKNITLKKDDIAYPANGMLWCNITQGSLVEYVNNIPFTNTNVDINYLLPVSKHLYLKSLTDKSEIKTLTTGEMLKEKMFFLPSINNLQNIFYEKLIENLKIRTNNEKNKITEKINSRRSNLSNALNSLQSIVSKKRNISSYDLIELNEADLLLKTCQLIGNEVGFTFEKPKFLETYKGSITNELYAIAQSSKIRVRKIILRGTWWKQENGHLLAFYENSKKPVALIQKTPNTYVLKEADTGKTIVIDYKVIEKLEPVGYMFFYGFNGVISSVKLLIKFAGQGLLKDSRLLILAALLGSLIGLLTPILTGIIFDDVIPSADKSLHLEIFIIMLMVGFITAGLQLTKGILQLRLESKSSINLQAGVMDHLLRLPVTFYRKYTAGDLTNRALSINAVRQILSNTVLTAILSGGFSFVNLILLFYYDSSLAWVGAGLALLAIIFITSIALLKLKYDRKISNIQGELQGFLFEFLSGITKIRITGGETRVFSLWATKFSKLKQLGFSSGSYQNYVETFNSSYPLLTNIIFFAFIYYTVTHSTITSSIISVGAFMAFISAFNQFLGDSLKMSMALISSLNVITLYERVKPILEEVPESSEQSVDPGELVGKIEMNSVSFKYQPDQPLILNKISIIINPGEMVAFVGTSGSGKSTIMRLLLGFEEPNSGSIYYDGNAYDSMNKELVRRQIGVVLQNGALMSGSIYKNIVGNSELTLEDAWEAARMVGMENDIRQMPMEMHTAISEGAGTFSGGQRQRLMIARAIVHKPRLIFLDEATSALDNKTQNIVSESLNKLQATRIVIAHRLSTIKNADRIYVLDEGVIVEFGTYKELMEINGVFYKLAKRQIA